MAKKRVNTGKVRVRRRASAASVAQGEAARVWRRDMTTQLEILISDADSVSARAIDAAREITTLLARRPKLEKAASAEAPSNEKRGMGIGRRPGERLPGS